MIKQTQQQVNDTRQLKHFTRKQYLQSIAKIGIQLEGWNEEQLQIQQNGEYICNNPFLNTLGRYVWLTKGEQAEVTNATAHFNNDTKLHKKLKEMETCLAVNDDGLEIISWKLLKLQLNRKKKGRQMIDVFEKIAEMCGDNTDDWYVSKTPIPTSNLNVYIDELEVA